MGYNERSGFAPMASNTFVRVLVVLVVAVSLPGCSIKKMAINTVGNALAESGSNFAADDDPELIAGALPFGLKTIEGLLAQSPKHKGLLFAACSGFTQVPPTRSSSRRPTTPRRRTCRRRPRCVPVPRSSTCARSATACAGSTWSSRVSASRFRKDPDAALAKTTKQARAALGPDRRGVGGRVRD